MNYIDITSPDINNGPGCRVTVWFAGCPHHCPGCHNQYTWDYNAGKAFDENAWEEIRYQLSKPYIKGLTLSGGDPLGQNVDDLWVLYDFITWIKKEMPNKDIWLYTGYVVEDLHELQLKIVNECDVVVDGPYVESLRDVTLKFRGSSNQRIIENK